MLWNKPLLVLYNRYALSNHNSVSTRFYLDPGMVRIRQDLYTWCLFRFYIMDHLYFIIDWTNATKCSKSNCCWSFPTLTACQMIQRHQRSPMLILKRLDLDQNYIHGVDFYFFQIIINHSTSAIPSTKYHQYKAKRYIISIPLIHTLLLMYASDSLFVVSNYIL